MPKQDPEFEGPSTTPATYTESHSGTVLFCVAMREASASEELASGCGAIVHRSAYPRRGFWDAPHLGVGSTVVPRAAEDYSQFYFPFLSPPGSHPCGCEKEAIWCSMCDSPLGMHTIFCQVHDTGTLHFPYVFLPEAVLPIVRDAPSRPPSPMLRAIHLPAPPRPPPPPYFSNDEEVRVAFIRILKTYIDDVDPDAEVVLPVEIVGNIWKQPDDNAEKSMPEEDPEVHAARLRYLGETLCRSREMYPMSATWAARPSRTHVADISITPDGRTRIYVDAIGLQFAEGIRINESAFQRVRDKEKGQQV
ncbi:hypothetical protein C8J57DRAFT_1707116 [Mycena rebaudengoi]|nr:hypothetical protein C8J57DRAFT_1707116 [Mycena rebaudengoi]